MICRRQFKSVQNENYFLENIVGKRENAVYRPWGQIWQVFSPFPTMFSKVVNYRKKKKYTCNMQIITFPLIVFFSFQSIVQSES